jgi:23S rRNA pseudouridine1911/1915/1917 synthase
MAKFKIYNPDWTLYEDKDIIIVNKPPTIAIQSGLLVKKSLYSLVQEHLDCDLQLIHRLDQPVSGAVIFAKHLKAAIPLFSQFEQRTVQKVYYAVVDSKPPATKGTIVSYLEKDGKHNKSHSFEDERPKAKKSMLTYEIIGVNDNFHLLKVHLFTGRHHQIRVQLSSINCSIRGDIKYGFRRSNKDRSINLHARFLTIVHPFTRKEINIVAPFPNQPIWSSFKPYREEE